MLILEENIKLKEMSKNYDEDIKNTEDLNEHKEKFMKNIDENTKLVDEINKLKSVWIFK